VAAPWFAGLAGDREAAPVVRLLTAVILVEGVTAVRSGALMRHFQQDRLILANLIGLVVNATVAIVMADSGAGPYSFAGGQVAGAVVTGVLVFIWAAVPVQVGLDRQIAGKLMRFGVPLAASLAVEAVLMNVQFMIIGRLLGSTELGYYLLAFNVSTWALSVISSAVRYVSVAGFSRLSEQDSETLSRGVHRSMPLLMTAVSPIAALTAALAPTLVVVLYGGPWLPAAPALRFLMILTVVRILVSFTLDILMGAGATRSTLWVNLGWAVAVIPALMIGTRLDGIRGAAIGHAVVGTLVALPLAAHALHRAGVRLVPVVLALIRPLLAGAVAAGVALLIATVAGPQPLVRLAVAGGGGMVAYLALAVSREQLRQWLPGGRQTRIRGEAHAVD
jgi:O-antigen/teichoic acid export membrane protein